MQQQDNHEYPFLYQRQTCHQVQPNQATYQKRQKCQPATYLQEVCLRMFLLLITFLKASHSFRNRLLVICKNAYLFATMIMTSVSSPFSCCSGIVRLNLM